MHWLLDLFGHLKLPLFNGMADALQKANEVCFKNLEKKKTDDAKEKRISWKKARVQEQVERKLWNRRQNVHHTYGSESDDEAEDDRPTVSTTKKATAGAPRKRHGKCKCGSTEYKCTTHHKCPLNKNKQAQAKDDSDGTTDHDTEASNLETDSAEEIQGYFCTCGSEKPTHSRSCPLNPQNYIV